MSRKLKSRDDGKHKQAPRYSKDRKTVKPPPDNTTGATYI